MISRTVCLQSDPVWSECRSRYRWTSTSVRDALGLAYRPDDSISGRVRMALGTAAESAIIRTWLDAASGVEWYQDAALIEHPDCPSWATTTDGVVRAADGSLWIVEAKNRASGARYTEPGVNDMAERIQCLWHMACVPEAAGVIRLVWTGFDFFDDAMVRADCAAEIAALEQRVRDLDSGDPRRIAGAMLATEQALAVIRASRERWALSDDEAVDAAAGAWIAAKAEVRRADSVLLAAEKDLLIALGAQERVVTRGHIITWPVRADGRRGPIQIKPREADEYEW